ncbi:MAG: hypothetical protein M5R36_20205 [Deltaproteobacteria bacterium]|nr:hypothetical protein [Deltaproteobacteria bacterium]
MTAAVVDLLASRRWRRAIAGFVTVLSPLVAASCTADWVQTDIPYEPPARVNGDQVFGYEKGPIDAQVSLTESEREYDLLRVSYPSAFQDDLTNRRSAAWYYRQKNGATSPSIIVLPILGGDYGPSTLFAEFLARRGFNVLRFERKAGLFEDPNEDIGHARLIIIRSVIDIRRGLDWWLTQPEVDAGRLGICGISMGGIQGSLVMAVEPRIKAGAFLLNGGHLSEILMRTEEPEVVVYRDAVMKKYNWSPDEALAEARKQLDDIDPVVFAPNLDPTKVLLISPRFDKIVPYDLSTAWWDAAGRPSRITIPTGHYSAVFALHYVEAQTVDHFRRVFGE